MLLPKTKREGAVITGSSMADIVFLLLIFFLVTTSINVDTGISLVLPPADGDPPKIHECNQMNILVSAQGETLMDDSKTDIAHSQETHRQQKKRPGIIRFTVTSSDIRQNSAFYPV